MNTKAKRIIHMLALTVILGVLTASPVMAGSLSRTYSGQFVNDWSKTVTSGRAKLEYGFNTLFINEDTCYANHSGANHYAKIRNGNGVHVGPSKPAGTWSNQEVTHSGSYVTYSCEY